MRLPIVFNDRYKLNTKLGEGGLAVVYVAKDLALNRRVAVKLLRQEYTNDPTFLARFHKEAQSAASLSHQNIVSVHDFGQDHNRPYIIMEYVAGNDLRTVLDKKQLSLDQVVDYAIQICKGVGSAHQRKMVHGDLKPGNILVSADNQVKVADFGLARALGQSAMDEGELVWGTPSYFAPEQAAGETVMPATDVYAIGVILYEMLAGTLPFIGVNDQDVARKHLYERPPPISHHTDHVPYDLEKIVMKALEKDAGQRYYSGDELHKELARFEKKQGRLTAPHGQITRSHQKSILEQVFDLGTVGLSFFVSVLLAGLIPLWFGVYQMWYNPTVIDVPIVPTATLASNQIRVPMLIGFSEEDAQAILRGVGLGMEVDGYVSHPSIEAFSVTEQTMLPGSAIDNDGVVHVTLSSGQDMFEMPAVIGLDRTKVEDLLRSVGLQVEIKFVQSPQDIDTVVGQMPSASAMITKGSEVILEVSGYSKITVGSNFDNQILLAAYELNQIEFQIHDYILITFFWHATKRIEQNYDILIHITTKNGDLIAQYEGTPNVNVTSSWGVAEETSDSYQLVITENIKPGDYQIRLGLRNPNDGLNLKVISPGSLTMEADMLIVQEIRVN
ncbi:MAG: hypothetical protein B6242_02865 [Anaerolineaceae bacterium 4572_78]|nr:MAG: hypothetical protein B6242_02865 [Anaerolineaceae bacterium 4572_78]